MPTITMTGEGDTIIEALYDLSLNVEEAIKRARAAGDDPATAAEADGGGDP